MASFSDFTDPPHYPMYFIWNATDSGSVCTDLLRIWWKIRIFSNFHRINTKINICLSFRLLSGFVYFMFDRHNQNIKINNFFFKFGNLWKFNLIQFDLGADFVIILADLFCRFWICHFFRNQKWQIFFSKFKLQISAVIFIYKLTNRKTCVAKIDFKQYECQSAPAFNENKYALIIHLYTLIIKTGNFQGKNLEFG
jgi:hypothetical protein